MTINTWSTPSLLLLQFYFFLTAECQAKQLLDFSCGKSIGQGNEDIQKILHDSDFSAEAKTAITCDAYYLDGITFDHNGEIVGLIETQE